MADILNRDTRCHRLTVMKLEDKWFYTPVFPVHEGPREYDSYTSKAGSNGRGRRHIPKSLKQQKLQVQLRNLTSLLSLTVSEDQSVHQEVTSPLFPSGTHLIHGQVL